MLQTEASLLFKGEALAAFLLKPGAIRDAHSHLRRQSAGSHPAAVHGDMTVQLSALSEEQLKTLTDSKALSKVAG